MRIEVITMWHNEELLCPFFLNHYRDVAQITVLLDDCTDNTAAMLDEAHNANYLRISTGGLDDKLKAHLLSRAASYSDADLRVVVDADEFIYCLTGRKTYYDGVASAVVLREVFRHESDQDIDPTRPPLEQRRHGNPIAGQCFGQNHFVKPAVFPRGVDIALAPGNHSLEDGLPIARGLYEGVHWAMADPEIAVARRLEKRRRMSTANFKNGLTSHDWHITEEQIRATCSEHRRDPQIVFTPAERF